jgi:hypothetical protein
MKGLEFLKKAAIVSIEATKSATARTTVAKNRNPENADIRIFKDGSVYPSAALVAEFDLGYRAKEDDGGKAFDIFKTADCPHMAEWDAGQKAIFITAVDRKLPKTDMFSGSKYDETGAPKADVLTQGSNTFGADVLPALKEVYDVEPNEEGFIDLVIMREAPLKTDNEIYYIPKVISRGDKKGQADLLRRENLTLFPLVPAAMLSTDEVDTTPEVEEAPAPAAKASKVGIS